MTQAFQIEHTYFGPFTFSKAYNINGFVILRFGRKKRKKQFKKKIRQRHAKNHLEVLIQLKKKWLQAFLGKMNTMQLKTLWKNIV